MRTLQILGFISAVAGILLTYVFLKLTGHSLYIENPSLCTKLK